MKNPILFFKALFFFCVVSFGQPIINEVDPDTPGSDTAEFIEIFWTANTSLTNYTVVFFNGAGDVSYRAFDLDGFSTDANGFFLLANTALAGDLDIGSGNNLQNGADAVALYLDDASSFPNGTPVTVTNLIDALVYGSDDPVDVTLTGILGEPIQVDEGATSAVREVVSIQRDSGGNWTVGSPTFRLNNLLFIRDFAVVELLIYPNPTVLDFVNIDSSINGYLEVEIFDIMGKRVISEIIIDRRIDVSNLNTGIYIMKLTQNNFTVAKKLMKK